MLSLAAICCMSVAAGACLLQLLHVCCMSFVRVSIVLSVAESHESSGDRMPSVAAICCSCCMSVASVASVASYLLQLETEETGAQN
jgi:hypothetical protein